MIFFINKTKKNKKKAFKMNKLDVFLIIRKKYVLVMRAYFFGISSVN